MEKIKCYYQSGSRVYIHIRKDIWISLIYEVAGQLENIKLRIYIVIRIYEPYVNDDGKMRI